MSARRAVSRAWLIAAICLVPGLALAEGSPQRGRRFVEAHCARCHAVGRAGPSPLAAAPPFRRLHERYPVEDLKEALAEGIVTGHPTIRNSGSTRTRSRTSWPISSRGNAEKHRRFV